MAPGTNASATSVFAAQKDARLSRRSPDTSLILFLLSVVFLLVLVVGHHFAEPRQPAAA